MIRVASETLGDERSGISFLAESVFFNFSAWSGRIGDAFATTRGDDESRPI